MTTILRPSALRRRLLLAGAYAPLLGLANCGGDDTPEPQPPSPVPPEKVVLSLPKDMYQHPGAPTEWWWHIGTLRAGDRMFGFEINAASFAGHGYAFSQISLSDVASQHHYQRSAVYIAPPLGTFDASTWAQADTTKDWYARLGDPDWLAGTFQVTNPGAGYTSAPDVKIEGDGTGAFALASLNAQGGVEQISLLNPGSGWTKPPTVTLTGGGGSDATAVAVRRFVSMTAPQADPTQNIRVRALLVDDPSLDEVEFDLVFSQQGRPFFVWGTGIVPNAADTSLDKANYYFSFTRLKASGTITLKGQQYAVTGTTWMDHEYGNFGGTTSDTRIRWRLTDMQLDNGYSISVSGTIGENYKPQIGVAVAATVTLQDAAGNLYYEPGTITPTGTLWTSPRSGQVYAHQFQVEIPSFEARLTVTTRVPDQEFASGAPVYEGTAGAQGTLLGQQVSGDAWIEEAF